MADTLDSNMERAATVLSKSRRVVVFSGAGLSAESGIDVFRGGGGLWSKFLFGPIAMGYFGTPVGWKVSPSLAWSCYNKYFRKPILKANPNPGHEALAKLDEVLQEKGRLPMEIITQNVDGLHQRAGTPSERVHEVHGTVMRHRCIRNGHPVSDVDTSRKCPQCKSLARPDCVLFTEGLPEDTFQKAVDAATGLRQGDCMLVCGTSGVVYPAAGIPSLAKRKGATLIEVNLGESKLTESMDILLHGKSGETLPRLLEMVKGKL